MRKRILSVLLVLVMLLLVMLYSLPVEAAESSDLKLMRVTCYTYPPGSITASGSEVREGHRCSEEELDECPGCPV